MSLKKIIIGEPMPDKNDPKYKERYEREVEAGRKFAEKILKALGCSITRRIPKPCLPSMRIFSARSSLHR